MTTVLITELLLTPLEKNVHFFLSKVLRSVRRGNGFEDFQMRMRALSVSFQLSGSPTTYKKILEDGTQFL